MAMWPGCSHVQQMPAAFSLLCSPLMNVFVLLSFWEEAFVGLEEV